MCSTLRITSKKTRKANVRTVFVTWACGSVGVFLEIFGYFLSSLPSLATTSLFFRTEEALPCMLHGCADK